MAKVIVHTHTRPDSPMLTGRASVGTYYSLGQLADHFEKHKPTDGPMPDTLETGEVSPDPEKSSSENGEE